MHFRATSQSSVFQCVETGVFFPHDGEHPLSIALGLLQQSGGAHVQPYAHPDFSAKRLAAYRQEIDRDAFQEAFFEYMAGRPEKAQVLQLRRQSIQVRFPKPQQ